MRCAPSTSAAREEGLPHRLLGDRVHRVVMRLRRSVRPPPIANESPNPSISPSVSPGVDDFGTCYNSKGVTYPDGLKSFDLKVGTGAAAKSGQNAEVQYTGWLTDGHPFDSSRFAGRTSFTFQIGVGQVIPGWDEGLLSRSEERRVGNGPAGGWGV